MSKEKKWEIINKLKIKSEDLKVEEIVKLLLLNRKIKTKKEIDTFLHGDLASVNAQSVGIDKKQLAKALKRIEKAIQNKEQIVVYGDYDVDGITATAVLWETLYAIGAIVMPYIPNRLEEGYGLSEKGIESIILKNLPVTPSNLSVIPKNSPVTLRNSPVILNDSEGSQSINRDSSTKPQNDRGMLIITVDNGIVANEAVDFANKKGIDVIITDHHTVGTALPKAHSIVHTTAVCGAGVAYLLSQQINSVIPKNLPVTPNNLPATPSNLPATLSNLSVIPKNSSVILNDSEAKYHTVPGEGSQSKSSTKPQNDNRTVPSDHLSLVALATVADLVPLSGANRILLKYGLAELRNTRRPGLLALFDEAKIDSDKIGVYEIGHVIAPRLNAMGRLESAMDSLRILCTKDRLRAKVLADTLNRTNKDRQLLTQSASLHALEAFQGKELKKILFIAHDGYEEGIIGLVAGKLVEEYYLPAIVLSKGELMSKASARSIAGFNIIDFIRTSSHLLVNAGGHPMAAGFTIETKNILLLQEALEKLAEKQVAGEMLLRLLKIDCNLPLEVINQNFYLQIQQLGPFGMGNPEPTFVSRVVVEEVKTVGAEKKHLKLTVSSIIARSETTKQSQSTKRDSSTSLRSAQNDKFNYVHVITLEAIAFGMGDMASTLKPGNKIDIVYTISENEWNGRVSLQLKVKDIKSCV